MTAKAHYNIQNLNVHTIRRMAAVCVVVFGLLFLPLTQVVAQQAPKEAGQVTLLIGDVKVARAAAEPKALALHDSIYVGDLIESAESGHVQIRFIDNGVISLRPKSRLQIEQYDVDTQSAKKSAIRLNLQQGVIRSISGEATEAAHERFRLNTPITAIGVLGTDFLVKVENEKVLAAVYSGAIAIAPFNANGCNAQGLGPCQGAFELGASSNSVLFEKQGSVIRPKLIENTTETSSKTSSDSVVAQPLSNISNSTQTAVVDTGNKLVADSNPKPAPAPVPSPVPVIPALPEFTGFSWGRWASSVVPADTVSVSYNEAKQNKEILFFGDQYLLFRTPVSNNNQFPGQGTYTFTMTHGEVVFQYNALPYKVPVVVPAQLSAASLQINFANNQFASHFQMQALGAIPSTNLDVNGVISNKGVLIGGTSGNSVQGALNVNADSAALMFEKSVSDGKFQGISNWVRP